MPRAMNMRIEPTFENAIRNGIDHTGEIRELVDISRRRPRMSALTRRDDVTQRAYQLHYSCKHVGRYIRSSKRKIQWCFGFTNRAALRAGKRGGQCRGEEHEVVLFWSIKSKKILVLWNKTNISKFFREGVAGRLEYEWTTRSGEELKIVAHAHPVAGERQYDLLIDGMSFFDFPGVDELGTIDQVETEYLLPEGSGGGSRDGMQEQRGINVIAHGENTPDNLCFRLSMAGLNNPGIEAEVVDELHSDLFSTEIESLRRQITRYLPQTTDDMVTKAITYAFFVDPDTADSIDSSLSESIENTESSQMEVDFLRSAYEFVTHNFHYAPRPDYVDQALEHFQKQIEAVLVAIRNEQLSSDSGSRILLSIAAILKLQFSRTVPKDTILLVGLGRNMEIEDLRQLMSQYGEVLETATSKSDRSFAYCRFKHEDAVNKVFKAVANNCFAVGGKVPKVVFLSENMREEKEVITMNQQAEHLENIASSPREHKESSPTSTIPHLMAPLSYEDNTLGTAATTPDFLSRRVMQHVASGPSTSSTADSTDNDHSNHLSPQSLMYG